MFKRAWLVFALLWAFAFLGNGLSKADGIRRLDVVLAFAPLVVMRVARFIVLGAQPRTVPYRPRR